MEQIEKVTEYVASLFNLYHMSTYGFFETFNEETGERVSIPLFRYGEIDEETLCRISMHFGITKEEILSMDENAAKRYWNKYPFFQLYKDYIVQWRWNQQFKDPMPKAEEYLIDAIFGSAKGIPVRVRYNMRTIKERLIEQLKAIDELVPGIYHDNAEITDLRVATQTVFSYPPCTEMLRSFVDIIERIKELFFIALHQELSQDDANELNFLVSWTGAVDVTTPGMLIHYDTICMYRSVYVEEGYDDFYDYVKFKGFIGANPWRCQEFLDEPELVKKLIHIFPQAKGEMRKFALELTKFDCDFVWSDAEPIHFSDEEEREIEYFDELVGERHISVEDRPKQRTRIYVDKNRSETYGWSKYIKALKQVSGPVAKGGLELPDRSHLLDMHNSILRIKSRVAARNGGSNNG